VIKPARACGYGLDAQWSDDFHHSLHTLLTRTERGYFADFGRVADLAQAIKQGFVYDGRPSVFRRKRHGTSSAERPGEQFVICAQNHDQIANGYWGDRLASLVSLDAQKLAAAVLLCAPNVPMLFMGQEWGEVAPFLYFTSHTDPDLARGVREGRRKEYAAFVKDEGETVSAVGGFADPQAPETFEHSKLAWSRLSESPHAEVLNFYRDLIALRKKHSCLSNCDKGLTEVEFDEPRRWLTIRRGDDESGSAAILLCNLAAEAQSIPFPVTQGGEWQLTLWSGAQTYGGPAEQTPPTRFHGSNEQLSIQLAGWQTALYLLS
jgi:maltooligosyltrehalose trehalohydrolase